MPKGNFTALQRLKPIEANFGKIAQDEEDKKFKYREEQRLKDKEAQDQRDKIQPTSVDHIFTGVESLDDALFKGITDVNESSYADFKMANNDPNFANTDEYKIKRANRQNYAKNLKTFTDSYKTFADKLVAMGGELSGWNKDTRNQINTFFNEQKVRFGENKYGEPVAYVAEIDPDSGEMIMGEDGKPKMTEASLASVLKGTGMYDIVPVVDTVAEVKTIGDILGESIETERDGWTITEEQSWENKKDSARELVVSKLGSVRNPTALAKRIWADELQRDKEDWDEGAMTEVADAMLKKVEATYNETLKLKYNYAGMNQAAGRQADLDKESITPAVVLDSDSGKPLVSRIPGQKGTVGYSISFGDGITIDDEEGKKSTVTNVYVTADGKIFADKNVSTRLLGGGEVTEESGDQQFKINIGGDKDTKTKTYPPKGWETTKEEGVPLTQTQLTNIIKTRKVRKKDGTPYLNSKEFKDDMKKQYEEATKKTASDFNATKQGTGAEQFNKSN